MTPEINESLLKKIRKKFVCNVLRYLVSVGVLLKGSITTVEF
jgi:hypothetical protein